jgi:glycosyltransferase involved in cell wall biosynthesis
MQVNPDEFLVSIIVPTYRDSQLLGKCFTALRKQNTTITFEVIIVNSDKDQFIEPPTWPPVRVIDSAERLSPGQARNVGANESEATYLAFTDADCQPDEAWIQTLVQALDSGLNMVGGVVNDLQPFHPISSTDNLLQFADYSRGRPSGETDHLPGCNVAVNRQAFERVGGFSDDTPSGEDVILAERISRLNPSRAIFHPRMIVRHEGRKTIRSMWAHQKSFGFYRARLGLRLSQPARRCLSSPFFSSYFCVRRFVYLGYRTAAWNLPMLPRFVLFSPWILIALVAYGVGLYRGANALDMPD